MILNVCFNCLAIFEDTKKCPYCGAYLGTWVGLNNEQLNHIIMQLKLRKNRKNDDDDIMYLGEPDNIPKEAVDNIKKGINIKDLSHLISFDSYWEEDE